MPIYEFRCASCGHEFECLQKLAAPDPACCPHCGKATVVRLISPVGFRLKGGGWYETDFKRSNRHNVLEADKPVNVQAKKAEGKESGKGAGSESDAKKEKKKAAGGERGASKTSDGQVTA